MKHATLKRQPDGWFVTLCCEIPQPVALPATGSTIGIDLGVASLVTTSTGVKHASVEVLKREELKLRRRRSLIDRRQKRGSKRRQKALLLLRKAHQRLARRRKHQLDEISKQLIRENDVICIEDLDVKSMLSKTNKPKNLSRAGARGLRRNLSHASLATLTHMLVYKAEEAGRTIVKVDPRNTSQMCSRCGVDVRTSTPR